MSEVILSEALQTISAFAAGVGAVLFVLLLIRIKNFSNEKQDIASAEIDKISPHFSSIESDQTKSVCCNYSFFLKGQKFSGSCIIPVKSFLSIVLPPEPIIIKNIVSSVSFLIHEDVRIAGDEAIEHYLLQFFNALKVRFRVNDPSQNKVDEITGLIKCANKRQESISS